MMSNLKSSHKSVYNWSMPSINPVTHLYITNQRPIATRPLKRRLMNEGLKENRCEECGITEWHQKPIVCELHHVNGDNADNRLDNLKMLCPNCHSQCEVHTESLRARKRYQFTEEDILRVAPESDSVAEVLRRLGCRSRNPVYYNRVYQTLSKHSNVKLKTSPPKPKPPTRNLTKVVWPSDEDLTKMVWEAPRQVVAANIGCRPPTLGKYCLKWKIPVPPQGYWARRNRGETHEQALVPGTKRTKGNPHHRRFSDEQALAMINEIASGESLRSIARRHDIEHSLLSDMRLGKSYKHLRRPWTNPPVSKRGRPKTIGAE